MPIKTDIYTPRTMGTLVERMPATKTFLIDTFFKNKETFATEKIDVDFKKGGRELAPYVHPVIGGKTVKNKGYKTTTYTPPTLAPNTITTVDDILKRQAGENPYSGKTPAERAIEKMAKDFQKLEEMIARRVEEMAAKAIFSGQIPIIGEGINEVIDFGFENQETIVTTSKKWSAPTSDPIGDIKRWRKTVQQKGFVNCDVLIMADDVADAFVAHEKVQKLLDVKGYDLAVIAPKEIPNGATYIGTLKGLNLDIYSYNEWYLDDWTDPSVPVEKPLVPNGKLALMSTSANYSLMYGAVTMLDKDDQFVTVEGEKVPETWAERNPARRFLQLNSKPLPVPHEIDSWFVATVL